MNKELEHNWKVLLERLSKQFDEPLDMQALLFLIGVQELGKGYQNLSKDQKIDVMHIAICTLLSPYGYYEFAGRDDDGWPHWKATEKLPYLKPGLQLQTMKEAIIAYFKQTESPAVQDTKNNE